VFDHVTIRVSDREASVRFYRTVLATLGNVQSHSDDEYPEWDDFSLQEAGEGEPVTTRLHLGFVAPSRVAVDEFWRAGVDAGYRSDGEPGPRPQYRDDYYGGFLLDPDGNSVEAVHHGATEGGGIDHLWIRVADVAASRRFYGTIAPYAGLRVRTDTPELARFGGEGGSFTVLRGDEVTTPFHLAFPADHDVTVQGFHAAALRAGYADNGPPGERSVYHAGYYGAFVLDPDGHNVEIVNHHRD
jgi:catechol 2,3-dioxygenase-like lactoylglutathione lyase family enzyme